MKKNKDILIQQLIEGKEDSTYEALGESDRNDVETYRFLFKLLDTKPENNLSFFFSRDVTQRLEQRVNTKKNIEFYLLMAIICPLVAYLGYFLLTMVSKEAGLLALNIFNQYKWPIILGVITCFYLTLGGPHFLKGAKKYQQNM